MAREHLSERLKSAGAALLSTTDALGMQAQGAMWVFDRQLQDWRYYLVTSLVDTLGRRKTYRLLLDAFERVDFPEEMTVEDVYLGSPNDPFFQLVSMIARVDDGGRIEFSDCMFNNIPFDGVVFRSLREVPSEEAAQSIEKQFAKRVKDLGRHVRQGKEHKIDAS